MKGLMSPHPLTLVDAFDALGVSDDGRVATFAWNTARHLELYSPRPAAGACCTRSTSGSSPSR